MNSFYVNCIRKSASNGGHEHITHIGNSENAWILEKSDAIQRIDSGGESFYTLELRTGKKMFIGVVRSPGKAPYLRTHADGIWNDNLLAQSTCGTTCRLV
jgi:hypothetical protein